MLSFRCRCEVHGAIKFLVYVEVGFSAVSDCGLNFDFYIVQAGSQSLLEKASLDLIIQSLVYLRCLVNFSYGIEKQVFLGGVIDVLKLGFCIEVTAVLGLIITPFVSY